MVIYSNDENNIMNDRMLRFITFLNQILLKMDDRIASLQILERNFLPVVLKFTANVPWVINNLNEIEKMNSYYRHMNQCITILMLAFVGAG